MAVSSLVSAASPVPIHFTRDLRYLCIMYYIWHVHQGQRSFLKFQLKPAQVSVKANPQLTIDQQAAASVSEY